MPALYDDKTKRIYQCIGGTMMQRQIFIAIHKCVSHTNKNFSLFDMGK